VAGAAAQPHARAERGAPRRRGAPDDPGEGAERAHRLAGLGPLTGIAAGVGAGAVLGAVRAAGWRPRFLVEALAATGVAWLAGNGGMIAMGVTDPREWSLTDWISDLVPHLGDGLVTAAVLGDGR
jgi:hypothetical protein